MQITKLLSCATALGTVIAALAPFSAYANPENGSVVAGNATIQHSGNTVTIHQTSNKAIINWDSFDIQSTEKTEFKQASSKSIALNRIKDNKPSQIKGNLTANGNIILINPNGVVFTNTARVDVNSLVATTSDIDDDDFMNQQKLHFNKPGNADAKILNQGRISAKDAGLVGFVSPQVVNSGVITAKVGKVHLASGDKFTLDLAGDGLTNITATDDMQKSLVENTGTISSEGGTINLTAMAARNAVENLVINTGTLKANSFSQKNGTIYLHAPGDKGRIKQSKDIIAKGGKVTLATHNIDASGRILVSGDKGGEINLFGENDIVLTSAILDARGKFGGGTILIGGDYLGSGIAPHAQRLLFDAGTTVNASATNNGDGGKVILWSDVETDFYGRIYARGGANGGDGGFIETSSKNYLDAQGIASASAAHGNAGVWLLDPANITINTSSTGANVINSGTNPVTWATDAGATSAANSYLNATTIANQLTAGTSVIVQTSSLGSGGTGDITVSSAITVTANSNNNATLTLSAYGNIVVSGNITAASTGSGKLNIVLRANNADNTNGYIRVNNAVTTNGGDFTAGGGSGAITAGNGYAKGSSAAGTAAGFANTATITASGGNVIINGQGGTVASGSNYGINSGSNILTSGTGTITLTGIGGTGGTSNNNGVNTNGILNNSGSGQISLLGTAGTSGYGISIGNSSVIGSSGASYTGDIIFNANGLGINSAASTIKTSGGLIDFANVTNFVGSSAAITTSNRSITINGTGSTSVGAITTTNGAVTITSTAALTTGAISTSAGAVSLTNGSGNITAGAITTTGNYDISVTNAYGSTSTGNLTSGSGAITVTNGSGNLTIGNVTTTTRDVSFTNPYGNLVISGTSVGNQSVSLSSIGYIAVTGSLTGAAITVNSDTDYDADGTSTASKLGYITINNLNATGNVKLGAGAGANSAARGSATNLVQNGVYISGALSGANITINGQGGTYASGTNHGVSVGSNIGSTTGTITINGTGGTVGNNNYGIFFGNNLGSSGGGAINLNGVAGSGTGNYGLWGNGSSSAFLGANSGFTNNITLTATGAGMSFAGTIKTIGGALDISNVTNFTNSTIINVTNQAVTVNGTTGSLAMGAITTTNGAVSLTSVGSVTTGAISTSAGAVTITNGAGDVTTGAITTTNNAFSLTNNYGNITTGAINMGSGYNLDLAATGFISVGALTGSAITVNSDTDFDADGTATASKQGYIYINGAVTAAGSVKIGAGASANSKARGNAAGGTKYGIYASSITSGGTVTVNGEGGTNTSGGNYGVYIQGTTSTTGSNTITINGTGGSGGATNNFGINVGAVTNTAGSGTINMTGVAGSGTGNYGIYATGTYIGANTGYTGNITLNANGDGLYSAGTIKTAGGTLDIANVTNFSGGTTINVTNQALNISGTTGSLGLGNVLTTNAAVTLASVGSITTTGISTSAGAVSVTNGSGSVNLGAIATTGNNNISINNAYGATTTSHLTSGSGTITVTNGSGDINLGILTTTTRDISVTNNYGNIIMSGVSAGSSNSISLAATGAITVNGTLTGSAVTVNSDTDFDADGSSTAGKLGYISISHISASGNVKLGAGASANSKARGSATNGTQHGVYVGGNITASGSVTINGQGGTYVSGNNHGVYLNNSMSSATNVIINGTGGTAGNSNNGVRANGIGITSGTGTLNVTGIGGTGTSNFGILSTGTIGQNSPTTYTGHITLAADSFSMASGTVQTVGNITLKPTTQGTTMGIGSGSGALTFANLTGLTWGDTLTFGDTTNTGAMDINYTTTLTKKVAFLSSGDITLSGNLTSSVAGDAIIIGAGDDFLNSSNRTISLTNVGTKRWIIYSNDAAEDVAGGLSAAQNIDGYTYGTLTPSFIVSPTYNGTQNTWVHATNSVPLGTITITALAQNLVYGNAINSSNTLNTTYSFSCSDGCSSSVITIGPTFGVTGSAGTSSSGNYNVGTWTITPSAVTVNNGYTINYVTGVLTVTPATLTVSGAAVTSKTYDGTTVANLNNASAALVGKVGIDTVTLSTAGAAGTYNNKNIGTGKAVTTTGYSISGTDSGNYTITQPSLTGNITAANLTVSAVDKTYTYGITPVYTLNTTGLMSGDTVTGATYNNNATSSSGGYLNAGTWTITPSVATGTGLSNYNITYSTGVLLINPAALDITAKPKTKTYGTSLTLNGSSDFTTTGLLTGDSVSSVTLGTNGGLATTANAGSYTITPSAAVGSGLSNYTISYNTNTLTVNPASLAVTADTIHKTYDGNIATDPSLSFTYTGLVAGDTSASFTGTASRVAGQNAGSYLISQGTLAATGNYTITAFNTANFVIDRANLSITADSGIKTYGDVYSFNGTAFTYSGLQNSETIGSVTLGSSGAAASANVNTYNITPSAATGGTFSASNYNITYNNGTLTVNPAALTVTANARSKSYGTGVVFAGTEFTTGVGQLKNSDSITSVTLNSSGAAASASVGTYNINPTSAVFGVGSANNYTITYAPGTLTVTPYALTITGNNLTKTYSNVSFVGTEFTTNGLVSGDVISGVTFGVTGAHGTSSSGNYNVGAWTSTPSAAVFSNGSASNYTITYAPGTLTINPKTLTAGLTGSITKVYDGDADAILDGTNYSLTGKINSDLVSLNDPTSGSYNNANAATGKNVTVTGLSISGTDSGNYTLASSSVTGAIGEITKRILTISGYVANNKVYNNTTTATVNNSGNSLLNTVLGDNVSLVNSTAATFSQKDVGNNLTVTGSGFTLSGTAASNYTLTQPTATANITPASITISGITGNAKTYSGTNAATLNYGSATLNGVYGSDVVTLNGSGYSATFNSVNAGTAVGITASGFALGGTNASNYTLTQPTGLSANINRAALTITADNDSKVYGDTATFLGTEFTSGVGQLKNGETLSSVTLNSSGAVDTASIGSYNIVASSAVGANGFNAANYNITYTNGTLSVTPYALLITADNKTITYGGTNPTYTYSVSGLQNSDSVSSSSFATNATTTGSGGYNAGTWSITGSAAAGTGLGNYTITYAPGTLTVNKANLVLTAANKTRIYGASEPTFTYGATGLVNGDTISVVSSATLSTDALVTSNIGNYDIDIAGGTASNYNISRTSGTLSVTPRTLNVTANNKTKVYGAALPTLDGAITGFVNGDTAGSALTGSATYSTAGLASSNVGNYTITASPNTLASNNGNYIFSMHNGSLSITPATLTLTAANKTVTYGNANPTFTGAINGYVNGDTSSVVTGSGTYSTNATNTNSRYNAGTWTITPNVSGLSAANYTFAGTTGTLQVNKAALTVTADNKRKAVGAANPTFTSTIAGYVNGDTSSVVTGTPAHITSADINSPLGTYNVSPLAGTLAASNYSFNFVDGLLTVSNNIIGLTITANNLSKIYNNLSGSDPTLTFTYTGTSPGDPTPIFTGSLSRTVGQNAGTYSISLGSLQVDSNFAIDNFVGATFTINKAALNVGPNNINKVYGAAMPSLNGYITGVASGDVITATYNTSANSNSGAGTYTITPTLIDTGNRLSNYNVTSSNATFTITPASLIIKANDKTRIMGEDNPYFDATFTGLTNGDSESSFYNDYTLETDASRSSIMGYYSIVANGNTNPNYSITYVNGLLTVGEPVISESARDRRDQANPVNNPTISAVSTSSNCSISGQKLNESCQTSVSSSF